MRLVASLAVFAVFAGGAAAQPSGSGPSGAERARAAASVRVTDAMLAKPDPADWLMYSRTYDAQRFSPLDQIDRGDVGKLAKAWSKPLPAGSTEGIPIVHAGVMYLTTPGSRDSGSKVWALDAATGELLWEYVPPNTGSTRVKALAIYGDAIFYTAPAPMGEPSPVIALDAATGKVRWSTPVAPENHTSGAIVVEGKVISGRTCNTERKNCYIAAHDAVTGKEVWRFYTTPGAGEPGDESWAGAPASGRRAAVWGLPGTYDPARRLLFWGISNPMPNTRAERHGGNADAIPTTAPADLYSNSTVALKPDTGELVWYYQHLPGDDWDMDINHEKTLIRTVIDPSPRFVKWINPNVPKGVERDVVITVGEGGGVWVNDRATGQFLWAMPFPYDTPNFIVADIDVKTGIAKINRDLVLDKPGKSAVVCYWNTRSFWPTAYSPRTSSLYVPYADHCLDMARPEANGEGGHRGGVIRPGGDPARFAGLAKIDMRTGEIKRLYEGPVAGNGAVLATAGGLVFWGDTAQVLRAFDEDTGKVLWQSEPLGATVQTSTITYAVGGRQYVAVVNGESGLGTGALAKSAGITLPERRGPSINVFALPR
ncbi:MAG TPA: PQQ-binding-like beta-propeller repeat protein [Gammaproteobacteria bacterium]|nr:PQQ-binding-like beta-propeller repeat protein [Gammaproteobacteria bacterium]